MLHAWQCMLGGVASGHVVRTSVTIIERAFSSKSQAVIIRRTQRNEAWASPEDGRGKNMLEGYTRPKRTEKSAESAPRRQAGSRKNPVYNLAHVDILGKPGAIFSCRSAYGTHFELRTRTFLDQAKEAQKGKGIARDPPPSSMTHERLTSPSSARPCDASSSAGCPTALPSARAGSGPAVRSGPAAARPRAD